MKHLKLFSLILFSVFAFSCKNAENKINNIVENDENIGSLSARNRIETDEIIKNRLDKIQSALKQ
nr:hypothetical protein [Pyrinomonadaceae bacterium]